MPDGGSLQRVLIIGGGISGLAAAHRAQSIGCEVTLVERTPRLGGKVETKVVDGFLIESGPDSFVSGKLSVVELATELGIADHIISTNRDQGGSYVWWQGRLHPLPEGLLLMAPAKLGPLWRSSLLTHRGKLRAMVDLVLPRGRERADESLQSFVERRLGKEVLDRIAQPLIAGIHAGEPATMSLRASFPRFLEMELEHRSLIRAARQTMARSGDQPRFSHFASFRNGMGELIDALVGRLSEVDLRTEVAVTSVRARADDGFAIDLSDGTRLEGAALILAIPAREASRLLAELAPRSSAAIAGIGQVSTKSITFGFRSDEIPPLLGSGFVIPAAAGREVMGVSYLSNKWERRVPAGGFALLRAFVRRHHNETVDDLLRDLVLEELRQLIGLEAAPIVHRIHTWDGGLHQYTLGHLERVAQIEASLSAWPALALAGAAYHGIGLNECVASGQRAAERVAAAMKDPRGSVVGH